MSLSDLKSVTNGISDLLVICATSLGGNENYACAISWEELI